MIIGLRLSSRQRKFFKYSTKLERDNFTSQLKDEHSN